MSEDIKVFGKTNLAAFTTLKIGGNAECLAEAYTETGLLRAAENGAVILGKGSNVLLGDLEFVALNRTSTVERDGRLIRCDSGVGLIALARFAAANGLSGLEWACGIPGSVGGAAKMNAAAFGNTFADNLVGLEVWDGNGVRRISKDDINFSYRKGCEFIVLKAEFLLGEKPREEIEGEMRRLTAKRFASQPKGRSLGSVFKNPAGDKSAAYYIERCGFKGYKFKGLKVSDKHANFILNIGGATAEDFITLTGIIRAEVFAEFGITLEDEFEILGEVF